MIKPEPFKIEWDAPSHEHKVRSQDWYWAVGIITVSISIAAIIFGNYIFGILILLCAFSLGLFINKIPDTVHVVLTESGISKDHIYYPFESLESYWLESDHPHPKIILHSAKFFMPLIIIPTGETDPVMLDETLVKFLPERYHPLPIAEKLLEYIGF